MNTREVRIPGIAGIGQEFYTNFGTPSFTWKRALRYREPQGDIIVKTTSLVVRDLTFAELVSEKNAYVKAARYVPVAETLFVYMRDETGRKISVRIQKDEGQTLESVSDERIRSRPVRRQLRAIMRGMEKMVKEVGEIPDVSGAWPNIRKSKNIVVNDRDEVRFIDVTTPDLLRYADSPLGQIHKNVFFEAIRKFRDFLRKR